MLPDMDTGIGGLTATQLSTRRKSRRRSASITSVTAAPVNRRKGGRIDLSTAQVLHLQQSTITDDLYRYKDLAPILLW